MDAECVSNASNIAIALCALFVAVLGLYGLRTWRKEMVGKAKFDASRNIILLSYRLHADFEAARHPLTSAAESADRVRREDESPNQSLVLDEWHARLRRLRPLQEDIVGLQEAGWEAMTVLGEESDGPISEAIAALRKCYAELASAIQSHFRSAYDRADNPTLRTDQAFLDRLHRTVYGGEDDDLSRRVDQATEQLRMTLRNRLR